MAYIPAAGSEVGRRIEIDVRGKIRPATIKARPLYRKEA
jgi:glycine cleavage system aminomethyltransferase T